MFVSDRRNRKTSRLLKRLIAAMQVGAADRRVQLEGTAEADTASLGGSKYRRMYIHMYMAAAAFKPWATG
jgi:hypothetical protein